MFDVALVIAVSVVVVVAAAIGGGVGGAAGVCRSGVVATDVTPSCYLQTLVMIKTTVANVFFLPPVWIIFQCHNMLVVAAVVAIFFQCYNIYRKKVVNGQHQSYR